MSRYHELRMEKAYLRMFRTDALVEQKCRCAYCCQPISRLTVTAEHTRAVKRGGQVKRDNIKAACEPCNKLKGAMGPQAFLRLIKNPQPGDGLHVWDAWSRRRIWVKTNRACDRIMAAAV